MAGKTVPELTELDAPIQDADLLVAYRSPGPLRRLTASTFADYIKAFFSASGGGSLIGLSPGGTLQGILANTLFSSQFDSLSEALSAWMDAGGTLVINEDANLTAPFTTDDGAFLSGKDYVLTTLGPRTITYTGPATPSALRLYSVGGASVVISGQLTINGQSNAGTPFWIDCADVTGTARRRLSIDGLSVINAHLKTASAVGANGIRITGGFTDVSVTNWRVKDVTRDAGTGSPGSYGSTGLQIFGNAATTANAQRITVENFDVSNISTLDTPGSAAYVDGDGILIFQYKVGADVVSAPIIRNGTIREAFGRSIKRFATACGGVTEGITIYRSVQGRTGGPTEIAHQDGSGVIRDISIYLSGDANDEPGQIIGLSLGNNALSSGVAFLQNINIYDTTGVAKSQYINAFNTLADSIPRGVEVDGLYDPTGSASYLFSGGAMGGTAKGSVTIKNANVSLSEAIAYTGDDIYFMQGVFSQVINRAADVPAMHSSFGGGLKARRWGDWVGDSSVVGFIPYAPVWRGNAAFTNGLRNIRGGCAEAPIYGNSEVFGKTPFSNVVIAAGATYEFPPIGSYQDKGGDYIVSIVRRDVSTFPAFILQTIFNSTALSVLIGAIPGTWSVLSSGAPSGGGTSIEVWKDSTTQALRVTNYSATEVVADIIFNPF